MNYENEKNEVLNLSSQGYSSRKIAEKLGISKSKANNIVRENNLLMSKSSLEDASTMPKVSTISQDEVSKVSTMSNLSQQNMSTMSKITQDNMSKTSTIEQNTASILSKLPENVRILVENLVSPKDVELTEEERKEEVLHFIIITRKHLKSKELYRLFKDMITDLSNVDFLTLEDIDDYIVKLKFIIKEMEDLYSHFQFTVNKKESEHIYYLTSIHSKSILRYLYSMKMYLKRNGEDIGEVPRENNPISENWLSLGIKDLFPFTYDEDCANIELSLGI